MAQLLNTKTAQIGDIIHGQRSCEDVYLVVAVTTTGVTVYIVKSWGSMVVGEFVTGPYFRYAHKARNCRNGR